jgi:hypothetical protein
VLSTTPVDEGVIEWTYRLLLGREPENKQIIEKYMKLRTAADLRGQVWTSPKFKKRYSELSQPNPPKLPMDSVPNTIDAVRWGYFLLFERRIESE